MSTKKNEIIAAKKNAVVLASDAIEYQPDAIELANSKLPWWARMGVLWLFAFFVGAVVWASVGKVDVIVQCHGKVVTNIPNITMMPQERMVIDEICVREGDRVKKGDILFKFDPTINEADVKNYTEITAKLEPAYKRLLAEYTGTEYVPDNPDDRNQQIQKRLFDQRKSTYDAKIEYYNSVIAATESQITSVRNSLKRQQENIDTFMPTVLAYRDLEKKKIVSLVERTNVEMNLISYKNQLEQYQNAIPNYESQLASNIAERQAYIEDWRKQVADEFNETEQNMIQYQQQLEKVLRYRDYYFLVSPHDAVVHEVAKYAKGSAVREAEPLITLIPVDVEYYIEIEIPAKDVGKVKSRKVTDSGEMVAVGDKVRVKLTPYPFQTWGTMEGELIKISEDAFTRSPQQQASDASTMMAGNTYYRGQVVITKTFSREPENFLMKAGMEAQAEIITGKRRIISYIFNPLIKMLDESLREP